MKTLNSNRPHPPATALPNRTRWLVLFTTLSLCLAACAGDESEPAASASTEAATTEAPTTQTPTTQASDAIEPDPSPDVVDSPAILTAYLGVLDLPAIGLGLLGGVSGCEQQRLDEGLPVVLSHRVDGATLDPSDFVVTTVGGAAMTPTCATLEPATEDDELQTVLLTGPLGSSDDLPAEVAVVGELLAIDGTVLTGIATDTINTFETGPRLVLARLDPAGTQCASLGSSHEIQMTWEGGVTGPRGAEPGAAELARLSLIDIDGGSHPLMGFDDLGDGDNCLVACIPPDVEPTMIKARQNTVYDPTNNPNPATAVEVTVDAQVREAAEEVARGRMPKDRHDFNRDRSRGRNARSTPFVSSQLPPGVFDTRRLVGLARAWPPSGGISI